MLSMLPPYWSSCDGGGEEGQQAFCLVAKQAVEFPQVLSSYNNYCELYKEKIKVQLSCFVV